MPGTVRESGDGYYSDDYEEDDQSAAGARRALLLTQTLEEDAPTVTEKTAPPANTTTASEPASSTKTPDASGPKRKRVDVDVDDISSNTIPSSADQNEHRRKKRKIKQEQIVVEGLTEAAQRISKVHASNRRGKIRYDPADERILFGHEDWRDRELDEQHGENIFERGKANPTFAPSASNLHVVRKGAVTYLLFVVGVYVCFCVCIVRRVTYIHLYCSQRPINIFQLPRRLDISTPRTLNGSSTDILR